LPVRLAEIFYVSNNLDKEKGIGEREGNEREREREVRGGVRIRTCII
jgi:hypothetical protein